MLGMEPIKIKTNDIGKYFERLCSPDSDDILATSAREWNGLPVVAFEHPNGTISIFAVSTWEDSSGYDKASVAIARREIEKNPLIIPLWVAAECTATDEDKVSELMDGAETEDEKRNVMKGIIDSVANPDGFANDAIQRLGVLFFIDKAGCVHGEVHKVSNGDTWKNIFIRIDNPAEARTAAKRVKTVKIDTNDIKGFIESLDESSSSELFVNTEGRWNGLPVTRLVTPDGTTATFAVSTWLWDCQPGFDDPTIAIARGVIEKNPLIIPMQVVVECTDLEAAGIRDCLSRLKTIDEMKDVMLNRVIRGSVGNLDAFADDALSHLDLGFFLNLAAKSDERFSHGDIFKAGMHTGEWTHIYINIEHADEEVEVKEAEAEEAPRHGVPLDLKGMVDSAISVSSSSLYGLPIVRMPNGEDYLVARNDEERKQACRNAVRENIWKYRPDFLAEKTGLSSETFVSLQTSNALQAVICSAFCDIVEKTCPNGLDSLIEGEDYGSFLSPVAPEILMDCGYTLYMVDKLYKKS